MLAEEQGRSHRADGLLDLVSYRYGRAIQSQGSQQDIKYPFGSVGDTALSDLPILQTIPGHWHDLCSAIDLLVLESEAAVSDVKDKLQGLEAELQAKGGPLAKRTNLKGSDGTAWVIGIVVAVGSILLLANQVGPQQRERWGIGLLGFGAGVAVGKINRGRP